MNVFLFRFYEWLIPYNLLSSIILSFWSITMILFMK